jgi:hypothetical protein
MKNKNLVLLGIVFVGIVFYMKKQKDKEIKA